MKRGRSIDTTHYMHTGGLKFVRWDHTAKSHAELTVRKGDEVEIIKTGSKDVLYKVKLDGRPGYLPEKCFYRRTKVNFPYEAEVDKEISVRKGDIIGIIEEGLEGNMCKIMKESGGEGNIPEYCLYRHFEVYADHSKETDEQLSIKRGNVVGLVEEDDFEVFWKVYFEGNIGHVPSRCFEPPEKVHWDYESKRKDEMNVKKGDTVTMVDHHRSNTNKEMKRVRVRLGEKTGYILKRCFEIPAEVHWEHNATSDLELSIKKGNTVGLIENTADDDSPPKGYRKVRLGKKTGFIPKKSLEIPAKVVRDYTAAKSTELTVKNGDEVRIIDATAYIQVRFGDYTGEVPLTCINTNVQKIFRMLEKKNDDDIVMPQGRNAREQQVSKVGDQSAGNMHMLDEKALNTALDFNLTNVEDGVYYLQEYGIEKVGEIGLSLGLSFATMRSLSSEKFKEETVEAWLQKKDKVEEKSGVPTWKSLGGVLQKMGLTEAAEKISKDNTTLEMAKLTNFHWNIGSIKNEIKVVDEACLKWNMIGTLIGMAHNKIQAIENERKTNTKRFEEVLHYWIENGGNKEYPATWTGLRKILEDSELSTLSKKIRNGMQFMKL